MDLQHNLMAECRWGGVQKSKILRTSYVDGPQGECAINMTFFIAPHTNSNETANSLSAGAVFIIIVEGGEEVEDEFQGMKWHLSHHCQFCLRAEDVITEVESLIITYKDKFLHGT